MMKNFKLFLLSFIFIASALTSCTNDEPLVDEQNIEESEAITTSLAQLGLQFDTQGNLVADDNATGNIVFDFCFDFVYPLNLSYNNGTTVTINSLEDLIGIIINSNDQLYINGIEFPFDVEVYNDDTGAIEIETINNEDEFLDLLEDCDFDDEFDCECGEVYNPVCVEIEAPNGETFLMTYPNACYAECDGFTEDDFAENCEEDYNCPGGTECFEFNFPLTIITDNNETITVNSQEELDNALYNAYYFDFVYPFDVTLTDDDDNDDDNEEEVVTINNVEEFEDLLEDCFDYDDDCDCDEAFDPVCVQYEENGQVILQVFPNACYAECEGFTPNDFVVCEDDNNPSDCTEEDITNFFAECQWTAVSNEFPNLQGNVFEFGADGSVTITDLGNGEIITGSYSTASSAGEVFIFFNLPASFVDISSLDWTVYQCSEDYIELESNNSFLAFIRNCD